MAPADFASGEWVKCGVVQHNGNHRGFQGCCPLDGQIDGARGLSFDPVAETAQRPVGGNGLAYVGAEVIEGCIAGRALNDSFDLCPVLIMVGQRRKRDLGLARLAVAQDQQTLGRYTFRQNLATLGGGGQRRKPRVQRGENAFTRGGHVHAFV